MAKEIIDPWGSGITGDYGKIVKDFGLEVFDSSKFAEPNRLMRRGVAFAGRDLRMIADCIKNRKPYYALTGIMPSSEKIHFGTKMTVENMAYFQNHGAKTVVAIADLEALATRGVSLEEGRKRALEFHIPAYIALGLDTKKTSFYFQSENRSVLKMAYEFAAKVTLNEFRAIYGTADPSRIMAATTQIGDILYPQFHKRMPGIVPVGIDQEPHLRLTRDVIDRVRSKYGFSPVASIYNKHLKGLDGSPKMSKSIPNSCLELPEDRASIKRKILKAFSGGRDSMEEHRRLGGVPEQDMAFELLKDHLIDSDKDLKKIHDDYKSGKMLTGDLKQLTIEKLTKFMSDFENKMEAARKRVDKIKFLDH